MFRTFWLLHLYEVLATPACLRHLAGISRCGCAAWIGMRLRLFVGGSGVRAFASATYVHQSQPYHILHIYEPSGKY
jgi:hypothetical protein